MQTEKIKNLDDKIGRLQQELAALGPMRPGTLSRQYRDPKNRQGGYYQLSYTYRMKSRTEYVRPAEAAGVRAEIATFKRFKRLTARWVDLALKRSQLRRTQERSARPGGPGGES